MSATTLTAAEQESRRKRRQTRRALLAPALLIILSISILPLGITAVYSFLTPGTYGGVIWDFTPNAYIQFLFERDIFDGTLQFSDSYLTIYMRSIGLAFGATIGALLIGFPTAYFIATKPREQRNFWLFLITLPFWTNLLIRTYAMLLILRDEGLINLGLMGIGVIDQPLSILYTDTAVFIGLIYTYLPFMVLPLYASLEKLDFRLVEAGYDLYANRFRVLRHIIAPIAKPGILAGCILVFILAIGYYITPALVGGDSGIFISNLIADNMQGSSAQLKLAAALATILLAAVLFIYWLFNKLVGVEKLKFG